MSQSLFNQVFFPIYFAMGVRYKSDMSQSLFNQVFFPMTYEGEPFTLQFCRNPFLIRSSFQFRLKIEELEKQLAGRNPFLIRSSFQ